MRNVRDEKLEHAKQFSIVFRTKENALQRRNAFRTSFRHGRSEFGNKSRCVITTFRLFIRRTNDEQLQITNSCSSTVAFNMVKLLYLKKKNATELH